MNYTVKSYLKGEKGKFLKLNVKYGIENANTINNTNNNSYNIVTSSNDNSV